MFSSGIALDLQIRNLRTKILEILQNLIPGIITNLNLKYNKTGGLISGDVEVTGDITLTNTSISDVSQINFQQNQIIRGTGSRVAIGNLSGETGQNNNCVSMGRVSGRTNQGLSSVAIGNSSGGNNQGQRAVAIGNESGETGQSNNSIAIGERAGRTSLGFQSVAIGTNSGRNSQQRTINIGENAGSNASQGYSISLGAISGQNNQGENAIAIGRVAGQTNQGANTIAMGFLSGQVNQGINSIAIGERAGQSNQHSNSIILNATGIVLNTDSSDAFIVAPVREISGNKILQYDTTNKEISFSNTINISDNLEINTPILNIEATQSIKQTIGTADTYNLEMKILGVDGYANFNRFPVLSVKPGETEGIQIGIDSNFTNNIVRGIGLNPLKITQNEASEETDYIEVGSGVANIVMTENITLQTENITFTGAGLQSNSAGANSGQHLRIKLNGTFYKIALLDDI